MTCVPDVIARNQDNNDLFLLIACDGIWDMMDNTDAMEFVFKKLTAGFLNAQNDADLRQQVVAETCDSIIFECLQRGSRDNMSVILVVFSYSSILGTNILQSRSRIQQQQQQQDSQILNSPDASEMISSENPGSDVRLMDITSSNSDEPEGIARKLPFADNIETDD